MRFKEFLIEKSFSKSDIPDYFWVVFDLKEMKDQLKTGKIKGLKGISSSNEIQFSFLGVARDAMLQIPSKDLLKLNDVTRIMYNNPHYLISKNLWALKRIYNATQSNWADQVFGNLFEKLKKYIKNPQLKYDMDYYGFRNIDWNWSKKIVNKKIDNLKQLTVIIKNYIENIFSKKTGIKYNLNLSELQSNIYDTLLDIGNIYSDENEWVIKNDTFKVPKSSILYVLTIKPNPLDQKFYNYMKNYTEISMLDLIWKLNEYEGITKELKDQAQYYQKYIKTMELTKNLPYKIIEYDLNEFKNKQKDFWNNAN